MSFATTLATLRDQAELSQQATAERLGMARATYASLESGRRQPDLPVIQKIAELYQIAPGELIEGSVRRSTPVEIPLKSYRLVGQQPQKARQQERDNNPPFKPLKLRETLAYVLEKVGAKPNVGETVLYKLLYFIDFDYYEKQGRSITGLTYIHNHYGPSPVADFAAVVTEMKKAGQLEVVETKYFKNTLKKYLPTEKLTLDNLSADELKHIDETLARLSDKSAKELTELSHYDTPWVVAKQGQPLDYRDTFYRTKLTAVTEPEDEL